MTKTFRTLIVLITFCYLPLCAQKISHVANSGVFIESAKINILIDAFFEDNRGLFDTPSTSQLQAITSGQPPYQAPLLALVTHAHPDHFSASLMHLWLQQSGAQCITSPQVIEAIQAEGPLPEERLITYPLSRTWKYYNGPDFQVESAYSFHAGKSNAKIQNIIFLITIDGKKILHLGDAEMDLNRFQELRLTYEDIDVALVPFWYMTHLYGAELVKKYIDAKKVVAIHLPESGREVTIEKIKRHLPDAVVFESPGQSVDF